MNHILHSPTHGALSARAIPPSLPNLHGTMTFLTEGPFGQVFFTHIEALKYSIEHTLFQTKEVFAMKRINPSMPLYIHVALRKEGDHYSEDLGRIAFQEGQYNIFYDPAISGAVNFYDIDTYERFHLYFPESILDEFLTYFPSLQTFLDTISNGRPAALLKNNGWISPYTSLLIRSFLEMDHQDPASREVGYIKSKEILFLLLLDYKTTMNDTGIKKKTDIVYAAQNTSGTIHQRPVLPTLRPL